MQSGAGAFADTPAASNIRRGRSGRRIGQPSVKVPSLTFSVLLIACCPSLADQDERFVEFPDLPGKTRTYDLRSVQIIQPGRFTILYTSIDDPDVMRFELNALASLRSYCNRPDGSYAPPTDLFTLGPPDLPIKNVEVKSSQSEFALPSGSRRTRQFKYATWHYPYKRLAVEDRGWFSQEEVYFLCKDGSGRNERDLYEKNRTAITNGTRHKELFDCKRGLEGHFVTLDEELDEPVRYWPADPAKVDMSVVPPHSYLDLWYSGICLRVMHEKPYSPE